MTGPGPDTPTGNDPTGSALEPNPAPPGLGGLRRQWLVGLVIVVVLSAISIVAVEVLSPASTADPANLEGPTGQPAPAFALPGLQHPAVVVSLSSFRGKPLVINFWSSWCIPCRTEMPLLESAFRNGGGKVAFVGIDTNDTSDAADAFAAQVHVTYPLASDPHSDLSVPYGLVGLPITVFISPSGKILGRHFGQLDAGALQADLRAAFGVATSG
jgi:cytochrome c biogenesis protein CcmG/thiol:disulfide interchange protein DsbE